MASGPRANQWAPKHHKTCSGMTRGTWQSSWDQHGLQIPQIPIWVNTHGIQENESNPWRPSLAALRNQRTQHQRPCERQYKTPTDVLWLGLDGLEPSWIHSGAFMDQTFSGMSHLHGRLHCPASQCHCYRGVLPLEGGLPQCLGGLCTLTGIHMNTCTKGFPAEHCIVARRLMLLSPPVFLFNVVADRCSDEYSESSLSLQKMPNKHQFSSVSNW